MARKKGCIGINTKADVPDQRDRMIGLIMDMLSGSYLSQSVISERVRHSLRKLSLAELDSLYAMLLTTIDRPSDPK